MTARPPHLSSPAEPVGAGARPRRALGAAEIAAALSNPPPTEEQRLIIESPPDEPLLVVAGAGSGKTETMASRVVWLVANGHVEPDQVLGLTFTRKAATELAERIGRRLRRLETTGLWTPRSLDGEVSDGKDGRDGTDSRDGSVLGGGSAGGGGAEALGGIPVVSTYHSYAGRLVREHALRLGVEPEARLLSPAAAWQYAAEVVSRYDGDVADITSAESTITAAVVDLAGELAEHLLTPEDVVDYVDEVEARLTALPNTSKSLSVSPAKGLLTHLRNRRAILPMVRAYLDLKQSRDALDFADQMALAAELARRFPQVGAIERQRFRAVLLDEYQDTSEAQLVLLRSLYAAPSSGAVPVTAVGDPNQSIYGWRGASATTLTRFPSDFAAGGSAATPARVLQLSTSWRNDRVILDAANLTSAPLRSAIVAPLRPRPDAGEGTVSVGRYDTIEDEAGAVAAWVADHWRSPSGRRTNRSAAVLCRKRSQFPMIVDALEAQELPVEVVGLGGLLLTPEVNDIVSLLWVVQDPSRGDRLMRLLIGPLTRLGPADLDGLATWARSEQARPPGMEVVTLPGFETVAPPEFETEGGNGDGSSADESGLVITPREGQVRDQAPESADRASIVEALDDLPTPAWRGPEGQRISATGLERLHGLSRVVKDLRRLTGLPLPELVGEAERALGLDIEVLARPEHTLATARAHLDAFADVAAEFVAAADRTTLLGFLSWLDAAVAEERGLDTPTIESSRDAVQVLTVHAAKGLEWDCVAVPGLVEGSFPAREGGVSSKPDGERWVVPPMRDKGWCSGASGVPYDLRGDAAGLPHLPWRTVPGWQELKDALAEFELDGGRHELAEERRLAYVAFTRAKSALLLTAAVWGTPQTPRVTSSFVEELVDALPDVVQRLHWADLPPIEPGVSVDNPRMAQPQTARWPHDPMAARRAELLDGAERVVAAARLATDRGGEGDAYRMRVGELGEGLDEATRDELRLLVAARRQAGQRRELVVEVPRHLSASAVVQLATDRDAFALSLRRPMPTGPALAARRGTAFHAWVEQYYQQAAMVDVVELPGSADEGVVDDQDLPRLKDLFLASEWAARIPEGVEIAIETVLDDVAIRGRIDAVFARDDGGFTVVDWKTGAPPDAAAARPRTLQLGAYALAYARLRDLPARQVDGAFYYAQTGETVYPRIPREQALLALLAEIPG